MDGQVYFNIVQQAYDEERTKELESLGFEVFRFENKLVFEETSIVLKAIKSHFKIV